MQSHFEITEGVYDITCRVDTSGARYRVFLFAEDPPTLVDAGLPDTTDAVISSIAEIGVEPERLIITHGDDDHIGGFESLANEFDLETWVPNQTKIDFELSPDNRYDDGDSIGVFEAVHMPGHQPDNFSLIDEERGIVVMGDAAVGSDQRGLPAGNFHLPPAIYSQNLNLAEKSLVRLLEFQFDVALMFHGTSVTENAKEKLDRYINFPSKPNL